jgi:hypothetical protein
VVDGLRNEKTGDPLYKLTQRTRVKLGLASRIADHLDGKSKAVVQQLDDFHVIISPIGEIFSCILPRDSNSKFKPHCNKTYY